jgi:undecaprenyl-diphosphatase
MVFLYLILRKYYKYAFLLFLYPLIFAYSRIYLGVHFPTDIVTGYFFGATFGIVFYSLYQNNVFILLVGKTHTLAINFYILKTYFILRDQPILDSFS